MRQEPPKQVLRSKEGQQQLVAFAQSMRTAFTQKNLSLYRFLTSACTMPVGEIYFPSWCAVCKSWVRRQGNDVSNDRFTSSEIKAVDLLKLLQVASELFSV